MTHTIGVEDFLKNHILMNLKIHPSEKFGLYFDTTLSLKDDSYVKKLYWMDLETYESKPLDIGFVPDDYYFHGDFVLLKTVHGDKTDFHSCIVGENKVDKVCDIPFAVEEVGCGEKLYFTAKVKRSGKDNKFLSSTTSPFYIEGKGVVDKEVTGLFEADYSGRQIRVVSNLDMDLNLLSFDFENRRIAFTAFEAAQQKPVASGVYTYNLDTEAFSRFTNGEFRIDGLMSMDKESVFFTGVDLTARHRNDNQQVYKIDLEKGRVSQHGPHIDLSNEAPGIVTDSLHAMGGLEQKYGTTYYHVRVGRDRLLLYGIDTSGDVKVLDTGLKALSAFHVLENKIILIGLKDQNLSEIYCYKQGELFKLTQHNDWLKSYALSKPAPLRIKVDGTAIDGWVCEPVESVKTNSSSYPAVLMIHGGPKMIYSDVFMYDAQFLCAMGYYVFYANPMGSDGRGDDFADIRGRFDDLPYKQLMAFTDAVLEAYPQIDPDRLGVTGGSYGGYMTNHIVTQTHRFRAAVSERGISSMLTALTSSDIGYKFAVEYAACGPSPWENLGAFTGLSPIMHAAQVKTPTLFNHGKNDYRCHYTESLNMYSALCQNGVPAKLCLYEDENHSLAVKGRPSTKKRRYKEMSAWFDKYLKRG